MFTYLPSLKSVSTTFEATPPWQKPSPCGGVPAGISKTDFAKWCSADTTDHVFFTMTEGLIPTVRVGRDNPPRKVFGVVGDYDSDSLVHKTDADILLMIQTAVTKGGIHPNHMSRTFQNKIRLIWEFEKALPGDPDELLKHSIDLFRARAKLEQMMPGLDPTGLEPAHYFEQGHSWTDFGKPPVSVAVMDTCVFAASKRCHIKADSIVGIPLDVVTAEVDVQFPGRCSGGDFVVGTRVPLFWINDGIPRMGGTVIENGVVCYSDRSSKGFMSWRDIFGAAFVKEFEEKMVSGVLDRFAYDGNRYWVKADSGRWFDHPKENMVPRLKKAGFSDSKVKGQSLSPLEDTLLTIQDQRRVDGAAPFLYYRDSFVDHRGKTYINTSSTRAMTPSGTGEVDDSKWPFLSGYLAEFLEDDPAYPVDALHYLLAWMKRMWEPSLDHDPQAGQMVVVAGAADTGKTLFGKHVLGPMMGGSGDATKFVTGQTDFNRDLLHYGLWRIDDSPAPGTESDHSKFSDTLKTLVANGECNFRAMYRDNVTVAWHGRVFLTCNLDADAQGILPRLTPTILDKTLLFKARSRDPGFFPADVERVIELELPFFLDWLKNSYTVRPETVPPSNRFGVRPFHHHEIMGTSRQMSPEQNLADLIDMWAEEMVAMDPKVTSWCGNPTRLLVCMGESERVRHALPRSSVAMGKFLKKLKENEYWRLSWNNTGNANVYTLDLKNPTD